MRGRAEGESGMKTGGAGAPDYRETRHPPPGRLRCKQNVCIASTLRRRDLRNFRLHCKQNANNANANVCVANSTRALIS